MNRRRHAFTLIELLFAAAILAVSLLASYTFLYQGFENGVDLLRRDMADSIARTVIDRYGRDGFGVVARRFRGDQPRDILDDAEEDSVLLAGLPRSPEVLRRMGFRVGVGFTRSFGEIPTGVLATEVSWPLPGGRRRSIAYERTLVSDGTPPEVSATGPTRSRQSVPSEWGSAQEWRPSPRPARRLPEPGQPIERRRTFQRRVDTTEASREVAGSARISWAEAARNVAAAYQGGSQSSPALQFEGDAGLAARLLGPSGDLSRRLGDPAKVREARDRRREARFLARTGARLEPWLADDIPDGDYRYRLEGQDLRDEDGVGRVVGVYVLEDEVDSYHLVRDVDFFPDPSEGSVEGDVVYRVSSYQDAAGRPVILRRTETRLYFLRPGTPGRAWVRSLDAPDASFERQSWTVKQLAKLESELGLTRVEAAPTRADDAELVKVANPEVRWAGASGCDTGSCKVPPPRVEQRELVRPAPRRPRLLAEPARDRARSYALAPSPAASRATGRSRGFLDNGGSEDLDGEVRALESLAFTDPTAAIRRLDDVLLRAPDHGPARALRGRLFALRGNVDQATEDLRIARRDPRVAEGVLPDLAGLLIRDDQVDEAERLIEEFRAVRPDDPNGQTLALALQDRQLQLAQAAPPVGGTGAGGPGGAGGPFVGGGAGASGGGSTSVPPVGAKQIDEGWSGWSWDFPGDQTGSFMVRPSAGR